MRRGRYRFSPAGPGGSLSAGLAQEQQLAPWLGELLEPGESSSDVRLGHGYRFAWK